MATDINEIKETFALLHDWEDRYAYLIDLGRKLPDYPDDARDDVHLVKGCTSNVWMILNVVDGVICIQADSDAHIVRGLIALVVATYNGQSVDDIATIDMHQIFIDLGLSQHLSPNRRNGFFAMVERVIALAP
jgi:cysteine desulfuration protein SufE